MGAHLTRSLDEIAVAVEQHPPLLLGRHIERRRDVGEHLAQLGHELRHFWRRVPQRVLQRSGRHDPRGILEHLDERHVGRRALHLVRVADQAHATAGARFVLHGLGQPGLADSGFPSQQDETAMTGNGPVQLRHEVRALGFTAHHRPPPRLTDAIRRRPAAAAKVTPA